MAENMENIVLSVSATSNPSSVAGTIASLIKEHKYCEAQCVGAGAVNQCVKAIAIARGYVAPLGIDLITVPCFVDIVIDNSDKTAIKFIIEIRKPQR